MDADTRAELIEETLGQMRRVFAEAMSNFSEGLKDRRLPFLQHMAFHLAAKRGGITQSELAQFLGVSNATISGLVDQMETGGLVTRNRDEVDRRIVHVLATIHGRDLHGRIHDRLHHVAAFRGWSDADIQSFKKALTHLESQLSRSDAEKAPPAPSSRETRDARRRRAGTT
jgi:DNA-binding MarR family transcriptional regulator